MSLLTSWGWSTCLSPCLSQHFLEQISLLDFFLFAQKKCAKAYIKSILRADKYTLPSVSVGLLPLGLKFASSLSPCCYVLFKKLCFLMCTSEIQVHASGIFLEEKCHKMLWKLPGVILCWWYGQKMRKLQLWVKDLLAGNRIPPGRRSRLISIKKHSIFNSLNLISHYSKVISTSQLGEENR